MANQPETHLILVGYACSARPDAKDYVPEFSVPGNMTKQDTIDKHLETKKAEWLENLAMTPYHNQLEMVCLLDTGSGDILLVTQDAAHTSQRVGGKKLPKIPEKLPMSHKIAHWLTQRYHWDSNPFRSGSVPEAIFAGFNPRVFLKTLAAQCAEETGAHDFNPMPAAIWYDNQDHRDVLNAMIPTEFQSRVTFEAACSRLGIKLPPDYETHKNPLLDVHIAGQAVMRLGLLMDSSWSRCVEAFVRLQDISADAIEAAEEVLVRQTVAGARG